MSGSAFGKKAIPHGLMRLCSAIAENRRAQAEARAALREKEEAEEQPPPAPSANENTTVPEA